MSLPKTFTLVSASARALAFSLQQAGLQPQTFDLFRDFDLVSALGAAHCEQIPANVFPERLAEFLTQFEQFHQSPWIIGGGLERVPEVVQQLAQWAPYLGCAPKLLTDCADPNWLQTQLLAYESPQLERWQLLTPRTAPLTSAIHLDNWSGAWLCKSRYSSAGLGVTHWHHEHSSEFNRPIGVDNYSDYYLQEYITGQARSVALLSLPATQTSKPITRLLGVSEQWVGRDFCYAPEFSYCGSVGPLSMIIAPEQPLLHEFADWLTTTAGFVGPWGIDYIVKENQIYLIDINPRYTASMELYERCQHYSVFAEWLSLIYSSSTLSKKNSPWPAWPAANNLLNTTTTNCVGKAILFAPATGIWTGTEPVAKELGSWQVQAADLPWPESEIIAGQPIVTIFADGKTLTEVQTTLIKQAHQIYKHTFRTK